MTQFSKTLLMAVFATLAVGAAASMAQARQIYWTGYSYCGNTAWGCYARAAADADSQVRQSCMYDFGISEYTCMNAPVHHTENLGFGYDAQGNQYCSARVYIEVP